MPQHGIVGFVRNAEQCVLDEDHAVTSIDRIHDGRENAHVGLAARDDQSISVKSPERLQKSGFAKRRIMALVDDDRWGTEGRERRHQLNQTRVEPLAGHLTPVCVITAPRPCGILRPLGWHEARECRALAMRLG